METESGTSRQSEIFAFDADFSCFLWLPPCFILVRISLWRFGLTGFKYNVLISGLLVMTAASVFPRYRAPEPPPPVVWNFPAPQTPRTEIVEGTIRRNTTLVATLVDLEIPSELAHDVADLIKPIFDLRKIRFGNPFSVEKETDGTL